ncbi:chemotaxis protein CheW [Magnetococcales bacterium HHB-1]
MNFVLFDVGDDCFAFPTEKVQLVSEPVPVTPVPFTPPHVDGLVNISGQILTQIDLGTHLNGDKEENIAKTSSEGALLIAQANGYLFAFRIDRVAAMAYLEPEQYHLFAEKEKSHTATIGELTWKSRTALLLDPEKMGLEQFQSTDLPKGDGPLGLEDHSGKKNKLRSDLTPVLVCECGGESYAFPLKSVSEVAEIPKITPLPKAPKEVLGLASLRGTPLLTLSLLTALGGPVTDFSPAIIILEREDTLLGFSVDRICGIQRHSDREIHRPLDNQGHFESFIRDQNNRMTALIRPEGLVSERALMRYQMFLSQRDIHPLHEKSETTHDFLSFKVGNENCALPLEQVQWVSEFHPPEPTPNSASGHLHGLAQIRGEALPVADLRKMLHQSTKPSPYQAFVVARTKASLWALLTDRVFRVIKIAEENIEPVHHTSHEMITAVGNLNGVLWSILTMKPFDTFSTTEEPV